ncbi:MAG TPA: preprotein translocase subunit SecA [Ktedonobacterales bacterium]
MSFLTRVVGDPNERELKKIRPIVARINDLEDEMQALSDDDLRGMTADFKQELENGADLDDILPEAFAAVREAGRRAIGMRHFDVQLIGGVVLHQGKIAEMRTGEGKTLVATLPSYLNALTGKGVHIVTVNDYLAQRDRNWMGRIHEFLGLSVGVVLTTQTPQSPERRAAYATDITYATNNELGFDYLRDNMVPDIQFCVQRGLNYAIVDEVDNILIDEARTPLIISGQAEESAELYIKFARAVPRLREEADYTVEAKSRTVAITESGIDRIERMMGIANVYEDMELTRHLENALKAHALFHRDKEYIVRDGEVLIVDEFTGRVLQGRRYSEGLHQAIEAKENVPIQRENRTLATITFQNYFRLYDKLAGMTGTAMTEAEELHKIYKLDVVSIPTNRPVIRADYPDLIYKNIEGKFRAVVDEIADCHTRGQPVLVGTTSVENSEYLSEMLVRSGVPHNVLNAKQHQREAVIVAQAGRSGAVTIATNMAGRGTDIQLGGDPAGFVDEILRTRDIDPEFATDEDRAEALQEAKRRCEQDREKVVAARGLHIIGTERHESRRIDNQLRGRSGRQGDPGSSRFFVSLGDELMRRFGTDRVAGFMDRLGMDDDTPIESAMATRFIEQAQSKVEGYNFDIRKNVVEYDDVIAAQRDVIYADRRAALEHQDLHDRMLELIEREVTRVVASHTTANLPEDWDLDGLMTALQIWGIAVPEDYFPEYLNRLRRPQLTEDMVELALAGYATKEEAVVNAATEHKSVEPGSVYMRQFERAVTLQVVDSLWMDHIDAMDVMRSGIGLRGVAQRDPLVEFKREAYVAFEQLKEQIEHHIVDLLFRAPVQIQIQAPPPEALPKNLRTNADQIAALSGQAKGAGATATLPREAQSGASNAGRTGGGASTALAAAIERANRPDVASGSNAPASSGPSPSGAQGQPGPAATRSGQPDGNGQPSRAAHGAKGHGSGGGQHRGPAPTATRASSGGTAPGVKPGRNDPCYCGSGKKYKMCHGR